MKRTRWVFGAAAVAGVVALVAPAVGQGKAESASLSWTRSPGGAALTSYDFGAVNGGSSVSRWFRLGSSGRTKSGKLAIGLTGSAAFSITSDRCTQRRIGRNLSCWVRVTYAPPQAGTSASATLTARGEHAAPASLIVSAGPAGPPGHVYWANDYGLEVNDVSRDGGSVNTLVGSTGTGPAPQSLAADSTCVFVAVRFYGTVDEFPVVDEGGCRGMRLASGLDLPISVAVDGTNVYWVDDGDGTVEAVPVGGGSVVTLASGQDHPRSMATDGTNVYWVNFGDGTVNEVPVGGGTVTTLATGLSGPVSVAVDGTNVYWADLDDGTVNEVPLGGGPVTTLAGDQDGPNSVAVDGTHVYWTDKWGGTVREVPLGGGAVTTLARGQDVPGSVAVDGVYVYWDTLEGTVDKVRSGGGGVITLADGQDHPGSLAVGP